MSYICQNQERIKVEMKTNETCEKLELSQIENKRIQMRMDGVSGITGIIVFFYVIFFVGKANDLKVRK